ncbi:MAG: helix-turn-helix domain-containing protein [Coprococcus sp.]
MFELNISKNLIQLRRNKKITQDELADFIGVTKGSVSKWENGLSMPDIMLLPKLAAFYDVTVDELLGYEPQLSKEQIRKVYIDFCRDFVEEPFDQVVEHVREMIKRYYSCYPFLLQMCTLYINHINLAGPEIKNQLFEEAAELCRHITDNCRDLSICSQAVSISALLSLQRNRPEEVIEMMEPIIDNLGIAGQNELILMQAYQMSGQIDKAKGNCQLAMYMHMLNLIASATIYISMNMDNHEICKETIRRAVGMAELFKLDTLHPNACAQLYIQTAIFYTVAGEYDKAFDMLDKVADTLNLLIKDTRLHGDEYFDHIDSWIEKLDLGEAPVRDKRAVMQSIPQILKNPAFASLQSDERYKRLEKKMEEVCRNV